MTTGPVRASSEWLRLREPADAAARASELVEKVRSSLPTHGGATIHDLGCGTGSMAHWLAVRLPGPRHWVMYDRDDELLTLAAADPPDRASDGTPVTMEAVDATSPGWSSGSWRAQLSSPRRRCWTR